MQSKLSENIAIAKFTHSGTQIIDWTPGGSMAKSRNTYQRLITFVRESIEELEARGNKVELAGVFYHLGENDMSYGPYRKNAPKLLQSLVTKSRQDLGLPDLKWFVSQQPPTDDKRVNGIDVTAEIQKVAIADENLVHTKTFDLPEQEKKLVITTAGIVALGKAIAASYFNN